MTPIRRPAGRRCRTTLVVLAALILVPVWVARSVMLYGCVGQTARSTTPCCPVAEPEQTSGDPAPAATAACCTSDQIELASRTTGAAHELPCLSPSPPTVIALVDFPVAERGSDPRVATPRATGPPRYLTKQALLL